VVVKESGQQKVHMYGTSSGAIRAGAYAQVEPERVDRLVLSAFTYKGTGSPEIARRNAVAERYRNNPRRKRDLAMIRSIFTRDGMRRLRSGGRRRDRRRGAEVRRPDPSGTYLDMAVNLPLVDPKKVLSPVLMMRGAHDGNSTNEDLLDFYAQLAERRPPVRHPAAHRAQSRLRQQPAPLVVRGAQFLQLPASAAAPRRGVDARLRPGSRMPTPRGSFRGSLRSHRQHED
jgi:pimeloyl-ACP methyl ester carboxylesterase